MVPIVEEAGRIPGPVLSGAENLASTGIRSPDPPARSHSIYRLSYSAQKKKRYWTLNVCLIFRTNVWSVSRIKNNWSKTLSVDIRVMYPLSCSECNGTWVFSIDSFKNCQISRHENTSNGSRVFPCGQTDGQTDTQITILDFRTVANPPNINDFPLKYGSHRIFVDNNINSTECCGDVRVEWWG